MIAWVAFALFIVVMLLVDLWVFHRRAHEIHLREAVGWSVVWVSLALLFAAGLAAVHGPKPALEFLTAYLIEKSLSIDNLFVFLLIFKYFRIQGKYQHGVLFWGILGALVLRAAFIAAGVALIHRVHWIIYLFGGILILSGIRFLFEKEKEIHPDRTLVVRIFRRFMAVDARYQGAKFIVREGGHWLATPLLLVLLVVETTDIIFAVDSIPAVLAVSRDPFIVYTSNVFAILGLRALYFALAGLMPLFHYLHYGLAAILIFVGGKMVLSDVVHLPILWSLAVIGATLVVSVALSLAFPKPPPTAPPPVHQHG